MTKPEILEVVKQMLVDWQNAQKFANADFVMDATNCHDGFCYWLTRNTTYDDFNYILKELVKDKIQNLDFNHHNMMYYYKCISYGSRDFKEILQTRIDHLNRTIARLENEIANEKSN